MQRILICDDEPDARMLLSKFLSSHGYTTIEAANGIECVREAETKAPDAILLDLLMPELDGIGVLKKLSELKIDIPVMIISAYGDVEKTMEATKLGAKSFLQKPFDLRQLLFLLKQMLTQHHLNVAVQTLREQQKKGYGKLIGNCAAMRKVYELIEHASTKNVSAVLITGASGTGKDLSAQTIHMKGPRQNGLFVEVDCASLSEELFVSELFGHEKGAFTDAQTMKHGLFEVANGGTIFLDEIAELTLSSQVKLLRALENRHFKRIGGLVEIEFDACVIAATNSNLQRLVAEKKFREELFFRLNIFPIHMPLLKDRDGDILMLAKHFIDYYNQHFNSKFQAISKEVERAFLEYPWPGNVRELKNLIERIVILDPGKAEISLEMLPAEFHNGQIFPSIISPSTRSFVLPSEGINLQEFEDELFKQAFERSKGNQTKAAKLLGISRFAFRNRMKKINQENPE